MMFSSPKSPASAWKKLYIYNTHHPVSIQLYTTLEIKRQPYIF